MNAIPAYSTYSWLDESWSADDRLATKATWFEKAEADMAKKRIEKTVRIMVAGR